MEALALYLLKSSLCAMVFLGIYWCFFKKETFYHFNRYFLLTGLLVSVVFPFYTYFYEVNLIPTGGLSQLVQTEKPVGNPVHGWFYVAVVVYVTGACILLIRHLIGLSKIKRVVNQYGCDSAKGYKLVNTSVFKSSFSVFNYIIIDGSSEVSATEKKMIFEHELAHIKQLHWIDLLASQLFCMAQWFNPFAWLYLHAIQQNHEYLADQAVLKLDNSPAMYRAALINQSLGTSAFTFASSFSHFDKLKRINMMRKPASASAKKMAAIVVIPAMALFFWAFARPKVKLVTPNKNYTTRSMEVKPKDEVVTKKSNQIKSKKLPPLIYLDGVEIESMDDINPKDIKSIDVLKDKSATAIYGEKGKNGVILITSKKAH